MLRRLYLLFALLLAPALHAQPLHLSPVGECITNVFENGTPAPPYPYAKDLGDGRGYTCGRIGFTTADGDALEAVQLLTRRRPHNHLAGFLPALRRLAKMESGSVRGLRGFPRAWQVEATRPDFRAVQDELAFRLYTVPALHYAALVGIKTPLGIECLYDASIQHGDGDDSDSLGALVREAARLGTPSGLSPGGRRCRVVAESQFIQRFLSVRSRHLRHANKRETREVWAQSADRCLAFANLARSGNWTLKTPLRLKSRDYDETISEPS